MNSPVAELSHRLQSALDANYNVVDMSTVIEVILVLEQTKITKEQLETTLLARHINQMRRKTADDQMSRRLKNLLKKWREMVIPVAAAAGPVGPAANATMAPNTNATPQLPTTTTTTPTPNNNQHNAHSTNNNKTSNNHHNHHGTSSPLVNGGRLPPTANNHNNHHHPPNQPQQPPPPPPQQHSSQPPAQFNHVLMANKQQSRSSGGANFNQNSSNRSTNASPSAGKSRADPISFTNLISQAQANQQKLNQHTMQQQQQQPSPQQPANRKRSAPMPVHSIIHIDDRSLSPALVASLPKIPKRSQRAEPAPTDLQIFGASASQAPPLDIVQPTKSTPNATSHNHNHHCAAPATAVDENSLMLLDDSNDASTRKLISFNGARQTSAGFHISPTPGSSSMDFHNTDSDSMSRSRHSLATATGGAFSSAATTKHKKHKKDKKKERRDKSSSASADRRANAKATAVQPSSQVPNSHVPATPSAVGRTLFEAADSLSSDSNTIFSSSVLQHQQQQQLRHNKPAATMLPSVSASQPDTPSATNTVTQSLPPSARGGVVAAGGGPPLRKHQSSELTFSGKFTKSTPDDTDTIINIDSSSSSSGSNDEDEEKRRIAAVAAIGSKHRAFAAVTAAASATGGGGHPPAMPHQPIHRTGMSFASRSCSPVITMDSSDGDSSTTLGPLNQHGLSTTSKTALLLSGGESSSLPAGGGGGATSNSNHSVSSSQLPGVQPSAAAHSGGSGGATTFLPSGAFLAQHLHSAAVAQRSPGLASLEQSASLSQTHLLSPKNQRGRKKGLNVTDRRITTPGGSSSTPSPFATSSSLLGLKNQIDSMRVGQSKVKTTKELLADLQHRKQDDHQQHNSNSKSATSSPVLMMMHRSRVGGERGRSSPAEDGISLETSSDDSSSSNGDMRSTTATPVSMSTAPTPEPPSIDSSHDSLDRISRKFTANALGTNSNTATPTAAILAAGGGIVRNIEEEIADLLAQLPPIDRDAIRRAEDEEAASAAPICTCKLIELEPLAVVAAAAAAADASTTADSPAPAFDLLASHPDLSVDASSETQSSTPSSSVVVVVKLSPPHPAATAIPPISQPQLPPTSLEAVAPPVVVKKPPVRSIFDLDYDEEDDPIHKYKTEAAAAIRTDVPPPPPIPEVSVVAQTPATTVDPKPATATPPPTPAAASTTAAVQPAQAASVSVEPVVPAPPPPPPPFDPFAHLPRYEVEEDPDCAARHHFVDNKNRVTAFHVTELHNSYVSNVNGNWDDRTEPGPFDDPTDDGVEPPIEPELYDRVVPSYNHMCLDRIPKNLRHVLPRSEAALNGPPSCTTKDSGNKKVKKTKTEKKADTSKLARTRKKTKKRSNKHKLHGGDHDNADEPTERRARLGKKKKGKRRPDQPKLAQPDKALETVVPSAAHTEPATGVPKDAQQQQQSVLGVECMEIDDGDVAIVSSEVTVFNREFVLEKPTNPWSTADDSLAQCLLEEEVEKPPEPISMLQPPPLPPPLVVKAKPKERAIKYKIRKPSQADDNPATPPTTKLILTLSRQLTVECDEDEDEDDDEEDEDEDEQFDEDDDYEDDLYGGDGYKFDDVAYRKSKAVKAAAPPDDDRQTSGDLVAPEIGRPDLPTGFDCSDDVALLEPPQPMVQQQPTEESNNNDGGERNASPVVITKCEPYPMTDNIRAGDAGDDLPYNGDGLQDEDDDEDGYDDDDLEDEELDDEGGDGDEEGGGDDGEGGGDDGEGGDDDEGGDDEAGDDDGNDDDGSSSSSSSSSSDYSSSSDDSTDCSDDSSTDGYSTDDENVPAVATPARARTAATTTTTAATRPTVTTPLALPAGNNFLLPSFNQLDATNATGRRPPIYMPMYDGRGVSRTVLLPAGPHVPNPTAAEVTVADEHPPGISRYREWHEVVLRRSYNNELLTILPYVVID